MREAVRSKKQIKYYDCRYFTPETSGVCTGISVGGIGTVGYVQEFDGVWKRALHEIGRLEFTGHFPTRGKAVDDLLLGLFPNWEGGAP